MVRFRCNICGEHNVLPFSAFGRESGNCRACGCWVRLRAVIHALLEGLFGQPLCLAELPPHPEITGLGLSDFIGYSRRLEHKFRYTNTFYHQEPKLDIVAPPPTLWDKHDFLISSDVFEHVEPPVERAFVGAYRLLKPGGLLVLSVPFTEAEETVEHFPELFCWRLVEENGQQVLINRTKDGRLQRYENLVFHGGDGTTLEFRIFCLKHLIKCLENAGFSQIQVRQEDYAPFGILRQTRFSVPILARKPLVP
jgi:SAM-dependent methyltransferase